VEARDRSEAVSVTAPGTRTRARKPQPAPAWTVPSFLQVSCGYCPATGCGCTAPSFSAFYDAAREAGWRTDLYGRWTCPSCQHAAGWPAPHLPAHPAPGQSGRPLITTGAVPGLGDLPPALESAYQRFEAAHAIDRMHDTTAMDMRGYFEGPDQ
jgi:hypothetical protein